MLTTVGILLPLLASAQEPSSVPGAYRGPEDLNLLPANTLRVEGGTWKAYDGEGNFLLDMPAGAAAQVMERLAAA